MVGGESFGTVEAISTRDRTIDVKKTGKTVSVHPAAVYAHEIVPSKEQAECLLRLGDHVAEHGISGEGPHLAARDLLLRMPPRIDGEKIQSDTETPLESALRLAEQMIAGVLPVQGAPGTGKTYAGACMICRFGRRFALRPEA